MTVWLPIIGALVGLAATVVGWSLNQLGQWFGYRRDRKKALARAIYGMLCIRNQIRVLPEAVRMLSEKLQIPAAHQVVLVSVVESLFWTEDDVGKQIEESMAALAEYDPVLAARMRGRDQVVPLLKKLRKMTASNPIAANFWSVMEGQIMAHALPQFDEAILEIGLLHGRRMARIVRADLDKKLDVPEGVLTTVTDAIQQQIHTEQATSAQPTQREKSQPPPHPQPIPIWKEGHPLT